MKEFFSLYKLPIIFGGLGLLLAVLWLTVAIFSKLFNIDHDRYWCGYWFLFKRNQIVR